MSSDELVVTIEPDLSQYVDQALWEMSRRICGSPDVYVARNIATSKALPSLDPQSLVDFGLHGCWAGHDRPQETELERAVRQYNEENPVVTVDFRSFFEQAYRHLFGGPFGREDEAVGRDTVDCSASGGGTWSDFMARLDDALEDE